MKTGATLSPDFKSATPEGDNRLRDVCGHCGFIDYKNPRIVVGVVCAYEDKVLLCRRAIDPQRGLWTLPAGFLEIGETVEAGALREVYEEATARPVLDRVLAIYSVARISQVQIFFRGALPAPDFAPGLESLETALFAFDEIPWESLAFPSVRAALHHWRAAAGRSDFAPYMTIE